MSKGGFALFFRDAIRLPKFGRGSISVWQRNFLYFKYNLVTTFAWIFVEPLLYLFALGYGLGRFVTEINGQSYAEFIAPAMMATSSMFVGFFEGTYSTFTKMNRQNTYQTILLTPLTSDEIVVGELLWITSKALISVLSVATVLCVMGLVQIELLFPALLVLALLSWVFAAIGVWLSTLARSYEWFSYSQSGFIMPMSLFCGTYFPLEQLPKGLIYVSYSLPLTHALQSVRMFLNGEFQSIFFINMTYLICVGLLFTNLASARFERKLVL